MYIVKMGTVAGKWTHTYEFANRSKAAEKYRAIIEAGKRLDVDPFLQLTRRAKSGDEVVLWRHSKIAPRTNPTRRGPRAAPNPKENNPPAYPLLDRGASIWPTLWNNYGPRPIYAPDLAALRGRNVSGVYAIWDGTKRNGPCLYVGESHTGRLFDTITRHFREWSTDPDTDAIGRRRGGTMYHRDRVRVAWVETPPSAAQDWQYAEIQRLQPADNTNAGTSLPI